jgi:ribonucleotide reductase alpha subunit
LQPSTKRQHAILANSSKNKHIRSNTKLGIAFDSDEAKKLNERIFETIYYSALETSMEIAKKRTTAIKSLKSCEKQLKSENLEDSKAASLKKEISSMREKSGIEQKKLV